jgi:hypothetical protein
MAETTIVRKNQEALTDNIQKCDYLYNRVFYTRLRKASKVSNRTRQSPLALSDKLDHIKCQMPPSYLSQT